MPVLLYASKRSLSDELFILKKGPISYRIIDTALGIKRNLFI
jgi:hypothetical protein